MVFFFFQAEDGIRDADVTGVQTYALPIWLEVERGQTRPRRHAVGVPAAQPVIDVEHLGELGGRAGHARRRSLRKRLLPHPPPQAGRGAAPAPPPPGEAPPGVAAAPPPPPP